MLGCAKTDRAEFLLVKDGQPRADIVIAEKPTRAMKLAAAELQLHLFKMSGASLEIVTAPGTNVPGHIYVGPSPWAEKVGVTDTDLQRDMFRVVSGNNWLALVGFDQDVQPQEFWCKSREDRPRVQAEWEKKTGRNWIAWDQSSFKGYNKVLDIWVSDGAGTLYAVHDFLRSLGVEWYMPGELGEVIPEKRDIALPKVNKKVRPDVAGRSITFADFFSHAAGVTNDVLWYFRLGLGAHPQGFGHSMQVILSHPYTRTNHPDYYALYNGKRELYARGGKPCLSSEGLYSNMLEYAKTYFDTYPDSDAFPIMPTDGYASMCQCDLCKGKDDPERGYAGFMSDYVWGFANRVAGEIAKSHPGKKIGCCPYGSYYLPPKIDLHTNVIAMICRWRQNDADNPTNRPTVLADRKAWQDKLAPESLYTWDYYLNSRPNSERLGMPIFFPHVISEDLKSWKGILQGEGVESWKENGCLAYPGVNHLNIYVTARLYWNCDRDVDQMLEKYYERFFGPAREEMKGFYERAEKTWMKLQAADIEFLLNTLKAAEEKAGAGTVYGRRVALIRKECEPKLRELLMQRGQKDEFERLEITRQPGTAAIVDGRLDENLWTGSKSYDLKEMIKGGPPKIPASFKIGCDAANLYVAVTCSEPDTQGIKAAGTERDDTNVWLDDSIEVILMTPKHKYYQFTVNASGALVDVDRKQGLQGITWDSSASAAAIKGAERWTVELAIPFKDIDGDKPAADQPWHINIGRNRPRDNDPEGSIFVPCGKPTFHNTDKMSVLAVNEPTGEE